MTEETQMDSSVIVSVRVDVPAGFDRGAVPNFVVPGALYLHVKCPRVQFIECRLRLL